MGGGPPVATCVAAVSTTTAIDSAPPAATTGASSSSAMESFPVRPARRISGGFGAPPGARGSPPPWPAPGAWGRPRSRRDRGGSSTATSSLFTEGPSGVEAMTLSPERISRTRPAEGPGSAAPPSAPPADAGPSEHTTLASTRLCPARSAPGRWRRSLRRRRRARARAPTEWRCRRRLARCPSRRGAARRGADPSARSLSTTTRLSRWARPRRSPLASCTAPSRSVARSDGASPSSASFTAAMLVVDPSATRAGAPASTMATSSPEARPAVSSRAEASARAQRVALPGPLERGARMLRESSRTMARATDAPERRWRARREQRMKGVAPRTARRRTATARTAKRARSSRRLRRRAAGGVGGTRRAGGKRRSSACLRRSMCARIGAATRSTIASADAVRKLIAAPPRWRGGWSARPRSAAPRW